MRALMSLTDITWAVDAATITSVAWRATRFQPTFAAPIKLQNTLPPLASNYLFGPVLRARAACHQRRTAVW